MKKNTRKMLLIVDMQRDFITGTLAVPGAQEIVGPIQDAFYEYKKQDHIIALTACWHPENHCSFVEQGGPWPKHCVARTEGAGLQIGLAGMIGLWPTPIWQKGTMFNVEEYSIFADPKFDLWLKQGQIEEIDICGLARDYCVEATYQDAIKAGYKATVLEHLTRAVGQAAKVN